MKMRKNYLNFKVKKGVDLNKVYVFCYFHRDSSKEAAKACLCGGIAAKYKIFF